MRYGLILGALLVGFFEAACVGQSVNNKKRKTDTGNVIMDPIEVMPFHIYRPNMFVRLPDSLGGKDMKGFAVLNLYINRNAIVDSFVIVKLQTSRNRQNVIDYFKAQPMNASVRRYYPFMAEYIKKEVKIKNVPNVKPDEVTLMNLIVRFK